MRQDGLRQSKWPPTGHIIYNLSLRIPNFHNLGLILGFTGPLGFVYSGLGPEFHTF